MKKEDYRKLQGELNTMKMLNLKVNYSQLGRMYANDKIMHYYIAICSHIH